HGLGGEQDLRKMGGLKPKMIVTAITMWIGGLGLSGAPFLAGFFSKDEILGATLATGHLAIFALLLVGTLMTSFYTFRLLFLAFLALAIYMYVLSPVKADTIGRPRTRVHALLLNAWYVDLVYDRLIVQPLYALSVWLAQGFDLGVIDGIVNGVGRGVAAWGA